MATGIKVLVELRPGEVEHVILVALEDARRLRSQREHLVRDDEVLGARSLLPPFPLVNFLDMEANTVVDNDPSTTLGGRQRGQRA
jgi:hypothetical protein